MRKTLGTLAMMTVAMTVTGSVVAGDLYTIRTSDDVLRKFDTNTMTFTDIGSIGVAFDFGGMAYDSSSGTMYLVQGFAGAGLYSVDLTTGGTSLVGSHGFNQMFSLAYDPTTDELYGGLSTTGTGFYSLNRSNGSATLIGDPGINLDGLVYDPLRDDVVGAYAGPGDLYSMNRTNGSASLIYSGDFFNNCGIAYDADTDLYWMIDWSGNMYTFDPNNGYARTLVMSGLGAHDSLASAGPGNCLRLENTGLVGAQPTTWTISNAVPGQRVVVVYGFNPGLIVLNGFLGYCAEIEIAGVNQSKIVGNPKAADANGEASWTKTIPLNQVGNTILTQGVGRDTCPDYCDSNVLSDVVL